MRECQAAPWAALSRAIYDRIYRSDVLALNGHTERLPELRAELLTEPGALHWVDLEDATEVEARVLTETFHFHPLAVEDCLSDVNLPKVDDCTDYLLLVVHGIRFEAPTDQFGTREPDNFLGPNYLVTHHEGPMRSVTFARELCGKDLQIASAKGADFLLHQILDRMFENYFPGLDAIEDKMQLVQVEVFENPTPGTLDRIFTLKRDVTTASTRR